MSAVGYMTIHGQGQCEFHAWLLDNILLTLSSYSHGFLFPSEVTRVRRNIVSYPDKTPQDILSSQPTWSAPMGPNTPTPSAWAHSSVTTFGMRYAPPLSDLTIPQSVESLVEGSDMSMIREGMSYFLFTFLSGEVDVFSQGAR